jgi:hypothetical protein
MLIADVGTVSPGARRIRPTTPLASIVTTVWLSEAMASDETDFKVRVAEG